MSTGLAHRCYSASGLQLKAGLSWTAAGPLAAREFSSSRRCEQDGGDRPSPHGTSNPATELRSIFAKSSTSPQNGPRQAAPQTGPGRPVDARVFRASGANSTGPILRPTLALKNLRNKDRPGDSAGNRFGDRSGDRRSGGDRSSVKYGQGGFRGAGRFAAKPHQMQARRPRMDRSEEEQTAFIQEEDDGDDSDLVYEREKRERERPKPERYTPEQYDVAKLKDTWPALPIGEGELSVSNQANVVEKMEWIGERYVGAFEPATVLAKMFVEGKMVYFKSEEEKAEVMRYVKKMNEERAQMLTIRKKEVVEPEEIPFEVINGGFVEKLVQGKYDEPKVDLTKMGSSPIVLNALKNLENNHTYQTTEGQKFMEKLVKSLPAAKPKAAPAKKQVLA